MRVEKRADGLHISGYVNVTGRESRPVYSLKQNKKVIEIIEPRAFRKSLESGRAVVMTLDHDESRVLATTEQRSLRLREDNVGLYAEATITDEEVIRNAKKLRGWSFTMSNVVDQVEERADKLPLRRVKQLELSEITLSLKTVPFYSATSIELRAGEKGDEEEIRLERRSSEEEIEYNEETENKMEDLEKRLKFLERITT